MIKRVLFCTALCAGSAAAASAAPALTLADIFTDHMVLQRDAPLPVWGEAPPGALVTVAAGGREALATADASGRWRAELAPLTAGGPIELSVSTTETIRLSDVLVGDVWLCSGQSNMQWEVKRSKDAPESISAANHPRIRLFDVERSVAFQPQEKFAPPAFGGKAAWKICAPETIGDFSAVGYFFGRAVHQDQNVPVGLISAPWGGMPAEAFISATRLSQHPDFAPLLKNADWRTSDAGRVKENHREAVMRWKEELKRSDPGTDKWNASGFDDSAWEEAKVPMLWNEQKGALAKHDGFVWFRKDVNVPADMAGRDLALCLGEIDDGDEAWFNGERVGESEYYFINRKYQVPGALVKPGRNVIAVRVFDAGGDGGFKGGDEPICLKPADDSATASEPLALEEGWRFALGLDLRKQPRRPADPMNPALSTVLYNAMISPVIPFGIKGVIWYQGEANAGRAYQYRTLFPLLIRDWRRSWGQGDFPFLFVQLAGFEASRPGSPEEEWPELRQAQTETLSLPNTGMAVAIDIGDPHDIHPANKQDVGERLALAARRIAYGQDIDWQGPTYRPESLTTSGSAILVGFDHADDGLRTNAGELTGFTIAGEDRKFHPAQARIEGDTVVISSPLVDKPFAVRYGWSEKIPCTLQDKSGLPACPFRTDDWPWVTEKSGIP